MFENFWGQTHVTSALEHMIETERIPQTMLFAGPEGVGKATLARRFGARVLGDSAKIERDDLSLEENRAILAAREKMPPDKRNADPMLLSTHPDFVTFPPDGPLRQISIEQMRLLKERAQFMPTRGKRRIFLIDQVDRANDQAANSLLKTLEEPPDHMVLIMTAENAYDLLPTIRSRAVVLYLTPLGDDQLRAFVSARGLDQAEQRVALAAGSPGVAMSLDLEVYDRRRTAMLALLAVAAGIQPFQAWMPHAEAIGRSKSERLDLHLKVLYGLLRDVLILRESGGPIRNQDVRRQLEAVAAKVEFGWLRRAVAKTDELSELVRRNIQKSIALDALILELRPAR